MKTINFLEEFILAGGIQAHDGEDDGAGQGEDNTGADEGDTGAGEETKPKAFEGTQDDVNNLVAKSSKKAIEKFLKDLGVQDIKDAKSAMAEYKKIQDSQKTEFELATGKVGEYEKTIDEQNKRIAEFESKSLAYEKGVTDPKNQAKVIKLLSISDEEDKSKALDAIIAEYPMFVGKETPGNFGASSKGGGGGAESTEKRDEIRKAMGLK